MRNCGDSTLRASVDAEFRNRSVAALEWGEANWTTYLRTTALTASRSSVRTAAQLTVRTFWCSPIRAVVRTAVWTMLRTAIHADGYSYAKTDV
jgi:hypothetical protein